VEEEGQPASLLLLGRHDQVGHARPLGLALLGFSQGLLAAAPFAQDEVDAERAGDDDCRCEPAERERFGIECETCDADQGGSGQAPDERGRASR
jgi:hypothetical protein